MLLRATVIRIQITIFESQLHIVRIIPELILHTRSFGSFKLLFHRCRMKSARNFRVSSTHLHFLCAQSAFEFPIPIFSANINFSNTLLRTFTYYRLMWESFGVKVRSSKRFDGQSVELSSPEASRTFLSYVLLWSSKYLTGTTKTVLPEKLIFGQEILRLIRNQQVIFRAQRSPKTEAYHESYELCLLLHNPRIWIIFLPASVSVEHSLAFNVSS